MLSAQDKSQLRSMTQRQLSAVAQIKHSQATAVLLVCDPGGRDKAAAVRDFAVKLLTRQGVKVTFKGGRA